MKKITTFTFTIISLLLVFSSSSCNKENDDKCYDCPSGPRDTLYVEKDFLDYWYAETGSWWVFKRTDTIGVDIYDTMRVKYHERNIEFHHSFGQDAYERIKLYFSHSHVDFQMPHLNHSKAGRYDAFIGTPEYFSNMIEYAWVNDRDRLFYLPYKNGSMLSLYYPFTLHTHELRTLSYIMEDNNLSLETPYGKLDSTLKLIDMQGLNVRFYISKNIGISRMEIQGGQVWELIDCNVIVTQ